MLFVVSTSYLRPVDEVHAHLDAHRRWLAKHAENGRIVFAGPLESGDGGVILAHCENRQELDALIAEDAFHVHQVAKYNVQAVKPALRARAFPQEWAPNARVA
jgi:uncharacterized protein YciI